MNKALYWLEGVFSKYGAIILIVCLIATGVSFE